MQTTESKLINWLVISSANPDKVALTVKGALIGAIPVLILVASAFHWNWTTDQITQIIEGITAFVSGFLVLVGLVRKIFLTIVQTPISPTDTTTPSV